MDNLTKLFLLLFLVLFPTRLEACFMTYKLTYSEAVSLSDAIFLGERLGCVEKEQSVFIKYKITKIWKGDIRDIYFERFKVKNCAELQKIHNISYLMSTDSGSYLLFRKWDSNQELIRLTEDLPCTGSRGGRILSLVMRFSLDLVYLDENTRQVVLVDRNKEVLKDIQRLGKPLYIDAKENSK